MSMKEAYEKRLEAELDEWSAEIDRLKAKADQTEAETRLKYYEEIEEFRELQQSTRDKLDEMRAAGDDAWEDLKAGVDSAKDSMTNALRSAASRFK